MSAQAPGLRCVSTALPRWVAVMLLGLVEASVAAQVDDLRAFVLAGACLECHEVNEPQPRGGDDRAIPALGGRTAQEILTALEEYRAGTRSGTIMPRLARGYDAAESADIAAWLATQGDLR